MPRRGAIRSTGRERKETRLVTPTCFNRARAFPSKAGKSGVRSVKEMDISSEMKLLLVSRILWRWLWLEYYNDFAQIVLQTQYSLFTITQRPGENRHSRFVKHSIEMQIWKRTLIVDGEKTWRDSLSIAINQSYICAWKKTTLKNQYDWQDQKNIDLSARNAAGHGPPSKDWCRRGQDQVGRLFWRKPNLALGRSSLKHYQWEGLKAAKEHYQPRAVWY